MPLVKPTIGQPNWGPVLNDALDYLDAASQPPTGATGEFTTVDNKVVTVTDGIITSIEAI